MTKEEFLENLSLALSGKVRTGVITENVNYYEDYINTEVRKGSSEEAVLETLGDPRLIARTIVETSARTAGRDASFAESGVRGDSQEYGERGEVRRRYPLRFPLWVWFILAIIVVVLVVSAVFSLVSAILPILLPILLIVFLVKLFRD